MYLKNLHIQHLGPISDLVISPRKLDGVPVPVVLVGQNGAGKSLTLSVLLDAMTEVRRQSFSKLPEVDQQNYVRVSSKNYIPSAQAFSRASAVFSDGTDEMTFNEVVSNKDFSQFEKCASQEILSLPGLREGGFATSGFHKIATLSESAKKKVQSLSLLYFPYFRYEPAYWMSKSTNVDFASIDSYYGQAKLNPIRTNVVEETKRWLLNVLLDKEIYEKKATQFTVPGGGLVINRFAYEGPNTLLHGMVNEIFTTMLRAKDPSITTARIGIGPKGNRVISLHATRQDEPEYVVTPDIAQLSSGELMVLGLVTETIRSYELTSGSAPGSLSDVSGIVLVDEIDLHLHISFQRTVLPLILRKLPRVQFIISTHSPFFLLGMAETGEVDIFSLPIGNRTSPEEFGEFQVAFDVFVQNNEQFRTRYETISKQVAKAGRPLVITEGKTDWKHLKQALAKLKGEGRFQDLDLDFFEFDSSVEMGDTKLSQMCEYMATIPQQRKTIFVFDRDNQQILNKMSGGENSFRSIGNNVFSFCLPVPKHRQEYKNISIEFYYTDDAIRTLDPVTGKRLWFSNEIEIVTHPTSGEREVRALLTPRSQEERDKKVFDQPADKIMDDKGKPVGLSKAAFVEVIIGNPDISGSIDRKAFADAFTVLYNICKMPG